MSAEEALREVMVRHLPRAGATSAPEERRQACELLLRVGGQARSGDVRFLDALSVWFERVEGWHVWKADPAWHRVKAVYASILRNAIAELTSDSADEAAAARPASRPGPVCQIDPERPAHARVLILADHWAAAYRILRQTDAVDGTVVHTLICNNASKPLVAFAGRQATIALTTGVSGALALLRAWWQGRIRVSGARLHDDSMLRWLEREEFWIGLHAMGVIYRQPVFAAFSRGILNAHIGLLPEYRGRSVMEWSILAGTPAGITAFFMDSGIDTGREIVVQEKVDVPGRGDVLAAKNHLFMRDGIVYRAALEKLAGLAPCVGAINDQGRRYYVMSQAFSRVVAELLTASATSVVVERDTCPSTV